VEAAAATLVVNSRERVLLQEVVSACDPRVIPNGVALDYFRRPETATERADVVFCGVMNYAPNADAAVRLARDIWPGVRAARPDARLVIVGASPTPAVRRLATCDSSVVVTGRVPDVRPHLWDAAVSVAPLRTARGLQNKVLEALAAGLPVVTSRAVFDGLPDGVRIGCVEADTTDATAAAVLGLLALSPAQRRAKAAAARVDRLAWSHQLSDLLPLLRSVQRRPGAEVRPRLSLAARRVPADERQSAATVT
jgi:glycosyltransferase involved in cell wall biosynthesis